MADRPILFSSPMVRALLSGTKTQTRRLIKPQPPEDVVRHCWYYAPRYGFTRDMDVTGDWHVVRLAAQPGDRLWVKETWRTESRAYDDLAPSEMGGEGTILYDADADWSDNKSVGKTRVSIHMTRWASRMTLIVTDVKIERLQGISEEDAIAEGCEPTGDGMFLIPGQYLADGSGRPRKAISAVSAYDSLWQMINGASGSNSWDANPWVIAYTFSVIRQNIDQIARAA